MFYVVHLMFYVAHLFRREVVAVEFASVFNVVIPKFALAFEFAVRFRTPAISAALQT